MINLRNIFAFTLLAMPAVVEVGLGLVYGITSKPMSYHLLAMNADWSRFEPGTRALIMTLIKGYGSTHFSVGIAIILLLIQLKRGNLWAKWAIFIIGLPVLSATAYLSFRLALDTGAEVPWKGAVILLGMFIAGITLLDLKNLKRSNQILN